MHGALVSTAGQGANFALRIGSMVVLTRLLTAEDFGLGGFWGRKHWASTGELFNSSTFQLRI